MEDRTQGRITLRMSYKSSTHSFLDRTRRLGGSLSVDMSAHKITREWEAYL
jgi:hypothetical protein